MSAPTRYSAPIVSRVRVRRSKPPSRATATKKHTLCADLTNQDTRAREFRALAEASAEHPRAVQRVMVLERDALARLNTPHVEVLPGYEWLLEPANK